ncbi:hypothetical protein DMENIID0001_037920 [Sergentomyia squamirostris]
MNDKFDKRLDTLKDIGPAGLMFGDGRIYLLKVRRPKYNCHQSDECVLSYVCGYIALRLRTRIECKNGLASLMDSSDENKEKNRNRSTNTLTRGLLLFASDDFFDLVKRVDGILSQIVSEKMEAFTILNTFSNISLIRQDLFNVIKSECEDVRSSRRGC